MTLLCSRSFAWVAVATGVALCLPGLGTGLLFDDWPHRQFLLAHLRGGGNAPGVWWDMFRMIAGTDTGDVARAIAAGALPWWTSPNLVVAFLRPLAAATHALDYLLWPDLPWLMHVHNLGWYALAAGCAAALYRRVQGASPEAGLATLLYAVDEAHASGATWIASRNTVMTAAFVLATLVIWTHARSAARATARRGWLVALAALGFSCAHASSEGAAAAWPYLLAYALVLDPAGWRRATLALWPLAAVSSAWLALATANGFYVRASGGYVDPRISPLRFAEAVADRMPLLLRAQLGLPSPLESDLGQPWQSVAVPGTYALLVLAAALAFQLLRQRPSARFFALGALGSGVLTCAVDIEPRVLFLVGLGAHGLVAETIVACLRGLHASRAMRVARIALAAVLVALHVPIAMAYARPTIRALSARQDQVIAIAEHLPRDHVTSGLIVLNTTHYAVTLFAAGYARSLPSPRYLYVLGASEDAVKLTRPAHGTLVLEPRGGYLREPTSQFLRHPRDRFAAGQIVRVADWRIVVDRVTRDGRPARVRVEPADIDHPDVTWLTWHEPTQRFVRVSLPPVGGTLWLPGLR